MNRFALIAAPLVAVLLTVPASAAVLTYSATLNGASESPPNASTGSGHATLRIDTVANTMRVTADFSGLLGTTTTAHIHAPTVAPGTGTAGVATTTPTFVGFPVGVTSGTYDSTLDLTSATSYNPAFVATNGGTPAGAESALLAALAAGEAYFNIHTTVSPGGEIRGFLAVPEPAGLAAAGLGLAVAARRRRVRR